MKKPKNKLKIQKKTLSLLLLVALSLSAALSCSGNDEKSSIDQAKLSLLESKIAAMQADRFYMESEYAESISSLESKIDRLESQITSTPSEPDTQAESQYFGFGYRIENDEVIITSYSGSSAELIIPASIGGLPVVAIGDNAFENRPLVSVSIPETLKSIGWFAFSGCSDLKRIVIPKNVTDIGYNAFSGVKDLTVYTPASSHASQYAKSYGIKVAEE